MWSPERIKTDSGLLNSKIGRLWNTASAVPRYRFPLTGGRHCREELRPRLAATQSSIQIFRIYACTSSDRCCVSTQTLFSREQRQLDNVKSIMRKAPPN